MLRKKIAAVFLFAVIALLSSSGVTLAEEIRLNGAATVADRVIIPYKNAVEQTTGDTIVVVVNNAGKGLIDLMEGRCDAALSSASLETTIQAAKAAGKEIDLSLLRMHVVKSDEIVFVVNPSNPVDSLTLEQIKDIHTGKTLNWKAVGGNNVPITVFTDSLSSATRGFIKQAVLSGQDYSPNAKPLDDIKMINDAVSLTVGGIGGLGSGFVNSTKVKIIKTGMVYRPLGFITIGEPSKKVQRIIDAYKAEVQKNR
ncbi:MAG TPA: substrate-binding domain-containing protein [Nitrospirota bacterium]|nr:substrate-binding domain-containing protein [Nitrospirota bacterium]